MLVTGQLKALIDLNSRKKNTMEATINCQLVTNILQNILFKSDYPFKRKRK